MRKCKIWINKGPRFEVTEQEDGTWLALDDRRFVPDDLFLIWYEVLDA